MQSDPDLLDAPGVRARRRDQLEPPELRVVLHELLRDEIDRRQLAGLRDGLRFRLRFLDRGESGRDGESLHPRDDPSLALRLP